MVSYSGWRSTLRKRKSSSALDSPADAAEHRDLGPVGAPDRARGARRRPRRRSRAGRRAASTPAKPTIASCASLWSIRQSCRKPRQSTSPITAAMMIAARVACGQSVEQRRQEQHRRDEQQPRRTGPTAACARPRPRPTALRERLASTGKPCSSPAAEVGCAERDELLVRVDLDSRASPRASAPRRSTRRSRSSASASAPPLRAPISPRPSAGMARLGRPAGTSAMTATPCAARSKARLSATETAATTSAQGNRGARCRSTSSVASAPTPRSGVSPAELLERADRPPQRLGHVAASAPSAREASVAVRR